MEYFQIVRTDKRGRITGDTFDDPLEALCQFSVDQKASDTYTDVFFRKLGSLSLTMARDYTIAIISQNEVNGSITTTIKMNKQDPKIAVLEADQVPLKAKGNNCTLVFIGVVSLEEGKIIFTKMANGQKGENK